MNEKIIIAAKKDFQITWFSGGGGGGGQHKNKHDNCCRIVHPESGATAQCTRHKSALQNRKEAFTNLTKSATFKMWLSRRLLEIRTGETVEERVEKMLAPNNLKIEGINKEGQWEELL